MPIPLAANVLAALVLSALPQLDDSGLDHNERLRVEKGEAVSRTETYEMPDGSKGGRGKAWVVVKKDREEIFQYIHDQYESFPEFMPRLKKVEIKSRSEHALKVRQHIKVPLSTYQYTLDLKFDRAAWTVTFALDKSVKNDIKDTKGGWKFIALEPGKTLLEYSVDADTGKAIPKFFEDYLTRRDLPEILNSMRRRLESDGKWKKDD